MRGGRWIACVLAIAACRSGFDPVGVGDATSVGDAGLCLSPHDVGEWAHALASLVTDDNLHRELSQKALRRAQQFSWERAARETLEVYAKAAA